MSNHLTERLEQLAELQKRNLEPLQRWNGAALDAFERVARKNYELMGDMVDYAIAQSRHQLEGATPQDVYERQMREARELAEKIGARANEYLSLARALGASGSAAVSESADAATASWMNGAAAAREASATPAARAKKKAAAKRVAKGAGSGAARKKTSAKASAKSPAAGKKKAAGKRGATKKKARASSRGS